MMSPAKATILCIDNRWNQLIGRKILLERSGYKVLEATDGSEGLRLLLSNSADAVILDYQLPGTSGDLIAAEMKLAKPHVPIILLSAYGPLPKDKLKSVDIFLSKSQPSRVLLSTLHQMLNDWSRPLFYRWLQQWKGRSQGVRL
jgi:CheY-like chemotaxis protein